MGRLFWKFFLFIFVAQLLTILAVGSSIWLRTRAPAEPPSSEAPPPWPPNAAHPPSVGHKPPPPPHQRHHFPIEPMLGGALASLISAALLAAYVTKPIRHLRRAVQAAAKGDLSQRVSPLLSRRNDELADLGRDYDDMAEQLRTLLEGQRRLLHDVSHELRSPLARLQLAIGLAQQQPEQQARLLARIERESNRINQLIGELLTLSRIEANSAQQTDLIDATTLLSELIEDATFEAAAEQKLIAWTPPVEEIWLRGNAELLRRAFENIIRNALRFSPAGAEVLLTISGQAEYWHFEILDLGPGVPAGDLAQIFEPFYRGPQAAAPAGYGLGLAIARRVVEAHGGRIGAANRTEAGLRVWLELPKAKEDD
ncbi:HAMP domain-containing protein [Chitinibacter bivalviorum]|uniref:histidine kinase n=1 Tax=Chitinibacter bivalviorum TaxID=2739434 RepID=A0A7H9BNE6_9NEIS|nr:ATP-binding protein [Chitinibacter bivalviorum]QLG88914.1 HAMP domain-containing protein [Chitinibacter bivalviorum]